MRTLPSLLALTLVSACSSSPSGNTPPPPPPPPPPPAVAAVTLNVASAQVGEGGSTTLVATPRDAGGAPITGKTVTWLSGNSLVAAVSAAGVVTGVSAGGPVSITATSEGKSANAAITVTPTPVNVVTVTPPTASVQVGATTTLSATLKSATGTTLTGREVGWNTSAPTIATVANGVVTAVTPGNATITATSEGKIGTAVVTVTAPPQALFTSSNELRITNVPAEIGFWGTAVAPNGEAVSFASTKVYSRSAAGVWNSAGTEIPGTPAVIRVHADPNGGFWATGSNGVIVRRVAGNWVPEATGTGAAAFNAIAINADGSGIAGGNASGQFYHRNTTGVWSTRPQPVAGIVSHIGATSSSFALAMGAPLGSTMGFALRWDGANWSSVPLQVNDFKASYMIVVSPTEAYAVGQAGTDQLSNMRYTIVQWNGTSWQMMMQRPTEAYPYAAGTTRCPNGTIYFGYKYGHIYSKTPGGPINTFAVNGEIASNGFDLSCNPDNSLVLTAEDGLVARHNGAWTLDRWIPNLTGVSLGSATTAFVTTSSNVARNLGAGWIRNPIPLPNGAPILVPNKIWASGNQAFVSGRPAGHFTGTAWSWAPPSMTVGNGRIWGASPTQVFAVGNMNHIDLWNGTTWTESPDLLPELDLLDELDGAGSFAMAIDRLRTVGVVWNGTTWSQMANHLPETYQRIKVFGPNSVIAVGDSKTYHWNGTAWNQIAATRPGGASSIVALVGRSTSDLYAFTTANIYHFNGTTWSTVGATGGSVSDAALFGNQVIAVGSQGLVLRATLP